MNYFLKMYAPYGKDIGYSNFAATKEFWNALIANGGLVQGVMYEFVARRPKK
jgi:hypothetical protein